MTKIIGRKQRASNDVWIDAMSRIEELVSRAELDVATKQTLKEMKVVTKIRIKNVFANGVKVYMSFSGGKDSLCMADLVLKQIKSGEIDPKQLVVLFIDEEAIYDSIDKKVHEWRKKFIMAGARFDWWCIEVKHFSAYNQLTSDESYTCWDKTKEYLWCRRPPPFAIRNHPSFVQGLTAIKHSCRKSPWTA